MAFLPVLLVFIISAAMIAGTAALVGAQLGIVTDQRAAFDTLFALTVAAGIIITVLRLLYRRRRP